MKTYKHKKTGEIATYKDGILKSSGFSVEIGVEPSSEFWELVPQKEFEIMSFITNQDIYWEGRLSIKNGTIVKRTYEDNFYGCGVNDKEGKLLASSNWSIHSIKRLSDGEVFTIGNKVYLTGYRKWVIGEISVDGKYMEIKNTNFNPKTDGTLSNNQFGDLLKAKKPVFTTQDGVDMYKGDRYWFVDIAHSNPYVRDLIIDPNNNFSDSVVRFSTRELAEEYILLNKKCLSIQDVQNIIKDAVHSSVLLKELKDLVKSR
jgi:hypothetical protein